MRFAKSVASNDCGPARERRALNSVWHARARAQVSSLIWIPAEATLSFTTSIIKLEWLLKFEFVTQPLVQDAASGDLDDTVEMSLPIEVTAPRNIGEGDVFSDNIVRTMTLTV